MRKERTNKETGGNRKKAGKVFNDVGVKSQWKN